MITTKALLHDDKVAIGKIVKKSPYDNVGENVSVGGRHGMRRWSTTPERMERKLITKYNSMATFYGPLCQFLMICGGWCV